jgi:uncharacterized coiled-coil DUF342 family protein
MASDGKRTNTVSDDYDDDPTAELETLTEAVGSELTFDFAAFDTKGKNMAETVSGLTSDLESHAQTIGALQLEVEQLRSSWAEPEKEVKVLEEAIIKLTAEVKSVHEEQMHTSKLLNERDKEIESLRSQLAGKERSPVVDSEPRHRHNGYNKLEQETSDLSEIFDALRANFNEAKKSRVRLDQQIERAHADNAQLATELESKQALVSHHDQGLEELRKSDISAGLTDAEISDGQQYMATLVPLNDNPSGEHPIRIGRLSLGSGPDNDIQIESEFVSRHHAQIVSSSKGSILGDLSSTNGTYVNFKRITKHALRNGDFVTIGRHRFKYVMQDSDNSEYKSKNERAGIRK